MILPVSMILPLALACAGTAYAGFCDLDEFDGFEYMHGKACAQFRPALPGDVSVVDGGGGAAEAAGSAGAGTDDDTGPMSPNFSELYLSPYYGKGETTPIEFGFDMRDLTLDSSLVTAQVTVLDLKLKSPVVGSDGIADTCLLEMAVVDDARFQQQTTLSFSWTCSYQKPVSSGGGVTLVRTVESAGQANEVVPGTQQFEVKIEPKQNWTELAVSVRVPGRADTVPQYETVTFGVPAGVSGKHGLAPTLLRSGIIAGFPLRNGMATRLKYFSPAIDEADARGAGTLVND